MRNSTYVDGNMDITLETHGVDVTSQSQQRYSSQRQYRSYYPARYYSRAKGLSGLGGGHGGEAWSGDDYAAERSDLRGASPWHRWYRCPCVPYHFFHDLSVDITALEWSDWQNTGLQNCTCLKTLCLAFELLDLRDLSSDRWEALLTLLKQAPPDILNLRITFHPVLFSMARFCRRLGKQDWGSVLGVLQAQFKKLRVITLELIGKGNSVETSSVEPVWKRYNGHGVQDKIAQSFKGNSM